MNAELSTPDAARDDARLSYIAGLDGLRAIAVIAVLLYHAQLPVWGGFGGVEAFFVISGFLITALLLAEWRDHAAIDIVRFWQRRARRLLPPLFAMLVGAFAFAVAVGGNEPWKLVSDLPAALFYYMNWHQISSGQSYFEPMARPPLLQHLWSLAVEEQFYLVWPLVFAAGMRVLGVRGMKALTISAAVGSAVLMALLYRPGADPSRIYYGTDTRAAGVLFGAALALMWKPNSVPLPTNRRAGIMADAAGVLALGGLLVCFGFMSDLNPLLYRGGFALIAALTGVLIGTLLHPSARLVPALLGAAPMRWIGMRSYGLYLWHWPVFMVTRPYLDVQLDGVPLLLLRLAIVGVLVELSYRLIEVPARRGAIGRLWARMRVARTPLVSWSSPNPMRWLLLLVPVLVVAGFGVRLTQGSDAVAPVAVPQAEAVASVADEAVLVETLPTPTEPVMVTPTVAAAMIEVAPSPTFEDGVMLAAAPNVSTPISEPTLEPTPQPTPTLGPPQPFPPELAANMQALLDESVEDGTIPGTTVSIELPGYEPWTGSSGIANRSLGQRMETGTLMHVGSITKMFTAITVLQLVQEGLVGLDDPIGKYLPGIIPFDQSTTVRHLLGHRSGLFDYLEDSRFFVQAYRNPTRTWTPPEIVDMVDDFGAAFKPGTPGGWKYASTNYVILGMMIEKVTGRTLAQEMRTRIIDPIGLSNTYFAPAEEPPTRVAHGYIDFSDRSDLSMTFVWGTGNLISNADDLRLFADALWDGRLLGPEMFKQMMTLTPTGGAYDMPELTYGLGMMGAQLSVGPDPDGNRRADARSMVEGHIGGISGTRAAIWRVPATGVMLTMTMNQSDIDPNVLSRDVLDVVLDWQDTAAPR